MMVPLYLFTTIINSSYLLASELNFFCCYLYSAVDCSVCSKFNYEIGI